MHETTNKIVLALSIISLFILLFNSYQITQAGGVALSKDALVTGESTVAVIPRGTPKIYGPELQVRFDDVNPQNPTLADRTIQKLGQLDDAITLTPEQKQRYINILYVMDNGLSCEYCCGARAIIFENGEPACGCAHSYAMRGLTKYLLTKHGIEYTDAQILEEAAKWKALFFPSQIQEKAKILQQQNIPLTYANLGSNKYRGIEQGTTGGMVGGC